MRLILDSSQGETTPPLSASILPSVHPVSIRSSTTHLLFAGTSDFLPFPKGSLGFEWIRNIAGTRIWHCLHFAAEVEMARDFCKIPLRARIYSSRFKFGSSRLEAGCGMEGHWVEFDSFSAIMHNGFCQSLAVILVPRTGVPWRASSRCSLLSSPQQSARRALQSITCDVLHHLVLFCTTTFSATRRHSVI